MKPFFCLNIWIHFLSLAFFSFMGLRLFTIYLRFTLAFLFWSLWHLAGMERMYNLWADYINTTLQRVRSCSGTYISYIRRSFVAVWHLPFAQTSHLVPEAKCDTLGGPQGNVASTPIPGTWMPR